MGREGAGRTLGYLGASGAAVGAAWPLAVAAGVPGGPAAAALAGAWTVQAAAFVVLARRLYAGRDATRAWAAGIGLRGLALFVLWPASRLGAVAADAAATFGLGLAALMVLEAIWLAMIPVNSGSNVT